MLALTCTETHLRQIWWHCTVLQQQWHTILLWYRVELRSGFKPLRLWNIISMCCAGGASSAQTARSDQCP
jgi:hypothetical protein